MSRHDKAPARMTGEQWRESCRPLTPDEREQYLATLAKAKAAPDPEPIDYAPAVDRAQRVAADLAVIFNGPPECVGCSGELDGPDDLCRHRHPYCARCCNSGVESEHYA